MADTQQATLETAWLSARQGCLNAREQAKAWALREVWQDSGKPAYGMLCFIAERLEKQGGGHPSTSAVTKLLSRMDSEPDWFPGKADFDKVGAPAVMTGAKKAAIARSAMAMKEKGTEPTYAKIVAACPTAALNSKTKKPFSKNTVYGVLRENCYDEDPDATWEHKARYSKAALSVDMRQRRVLFAEHMLAIRHTDQWYYNNLVWTDLCNSILPRTEKKANEMALARKGRSGWQSPGCELSSVNLAGKPEALKQKSWDTIKVRWFPMLAQGKLHVDLLDADFPGETPEGAEALVAQVRTALNKRFRTADRMPGVIFTDRGRGFYEPNSGKMTEQYSRGLRAHNLRALMGENAAVQPGSMQDVLLHETAVSWIRLRLDRTVPQKSWEESREQY